MSISDMILKQKDDSTWKIGCGECPKKDAEIERQKKEAQELHDKYGKLWDENERLTKERDKFRAVLVGAGYQKIDNLPNLSAQTCHEIGATVAFLTGRGNQNAHNILPRRMGHAVGVGANGGTGQASPEGRE